MFTEAKQVISSGGQADDYLGTNTQPAELTWHVLVMGSLN